MLIFDPRLKGEGGWTMRLREENSAPKKMNNEPDMLLAAGIPCGYDTRGRKCHGWSPFRITMFMSMSSLSLVPQEVPVIVTEAFFPFYPHKSVQLSVFVLNHSIMHEERMVIPMEKLLRNLCWACLFPSFLVICFLCGRRG